MEITDKDLLEAWNENYRKAQAEHEAQTTIEETDILEPEEDETPWYAILAGFGASIGSSYLINNIIKNMVTMPGNLRGKILIAIGTAAVSGAVSNFVSRETERDVASIGQFVSKIKKLWIGA